MRNFQTLDAVREDHDSKSLEFYPKASGADQSRLALRREGAYVTISASYGPMEVAMRPRHEDLVRSLARLTVVEGLHTTRQVGTNQAYLAIGLTADKHLLMRLTIIADATGHFSLNVELTDDAREKLYGWLDVAASSAR